MKWFPVFLILAFASCSNDSEPSIGPPAPPAPPDTPEEPEYVFHDDYCTLDGVRFFLESLSERYYIIYKSAHSATVLGQLKEKGFVVTKTRPYTLYLPNGTSMPEILKDCQTAFISGAGDPEEIDHLVYINHLYLFENTEVGESNCLYVGFDEQNEEEQLRLLHEYASKLKVQVFCRGTYAPVYTLFCTRESAGNHVEIANWFAEIGNFRYGEPELNNYSF